MNRESYCKEYDILNIWDDRERVESSFELNNVKLICDINKKGKIVGIEIWDFKKELKVFNDFLDKILKKKIKKKRTSSK